MRSFIRISLGIALLLANLFVYAEASKQLVIVTLPTSKSEIKPIKIIPEYSANRLGLSHEQLTNGGDFVVKKKIVTIIPNTADTTKEAAMDKIKQLSKDNVQGALVTEEVKTINGNTPHTTRYYYAGLESEKPKEQWQPRKSVEAFSLTAWDTFQSRYSTSNANIQDTTTALQNAIDKKQLPPSAVPMAEAALNQLKQGTALTPWTAYILSTRINNFPPN